MKLRTTPDGLIAYDPDRGRWVRLPGERDLLAFLGEGAAARERAAAAIVAGDAVEADPSEAGLPFRPRSMRAFMLWESHVIGSSRMLVKHFFPKPAWMAISTFEKTGRTFPKLRPNRRFWEAPTFYMGNHTMVLADRQEMWWPSHTSALDFELELACVLRAPLADAQAEDARHNIFGPVIKSKTFANSIGCDVVTADEFGDWRQATGRVRVDGQVWCEGSTANPAHDIGEMLAYASKGERLDTGDVISTGTMPGCCGLELERWIKPGQTVELEIDRIGTVSNRISTEASPTTAVPA
jgi:Fumarylacetoacetate (FAA) hydrolase family